MKLQILGFLSFFLFALCGQAEINAPRLVCPEPVYDFGLTNNTVELPHTFVIRNEGSSPLVISKVRSGCGCTQTGLSRTNIPAGEAAELVTRLNLRGYNGLKRTNIYLHSNDPKNAVFACQITGRALAEMEISPGAICVSMMPGATNLQAVVTLVNRTDQSFHQLKIENPNPFCVVGLATNQPGKSYTLTVTILANTLSATAQGVITLVTDHPRYSRITIPVSAVLVHELNAYPTEIVMREGAQGQPSESRYIIVKSENESPFHISRVEAIPSSIPVNLHSLKPNWVRIKVGPLFPSASLTGIVIRAYTDRTNQPTLDIPFKVVRP